MNILERQLIKHFTIFRIHLNDSMDLDIAMSLFEKKYVNDYTEEKFFSLLNQGIYLLSRNSNTEKIFIYRFYKNEDLTAVNIALAYKEELMLNFLRH